MYEDCYAEYAIPRKRTKASILGFLGMLIGATVALLSVLVYPTAGIIAVIAMALIIFIFYRYLRVEYEYIFVQGEVRVDRIYSNSLRKKGISIDMEKVGEVAVLNPARDVSQNPGVKVYDYTSHYGEAPVWTVIFQEKGKQAILLFEPDENFIKTMKRFSPAKVKM